MVPPSLENTADTSLGAGGAWLGVKTLKCAPVPALFEGYWTRYSLAEGPDRVTLIKYAPLERMGSKVDTCGCTVVDLRLSNTKFDGEKGKL